MRWEAPAEFRQVAPTYPMRAAQYNVGPDAEEKAALLTVFENLGGSIQQNADRWVGQFRNADDPGAPPVSKVTPRVGDALPITTVFVEGAYRASPMMGGSGESEPGKALLGAIVNGPAGLVFFKLIGPTETVQSAEEPFNRLLQSIHPI